MKRQLTTASVAVSLFPFLAVLLCTMGILVMMLVVGVKSAQMKADENEIVRNEQHAEDVLQRQIDLDEAEIRIEVWSRARPGLVEKVRDARDKRVYLEQVLNELAREKSQLAAQLVALKSTDGPATPTDAIAAERMELDREIEQLQQQIAQRKNQPPPATVYSIVPYSGPTSTQRRPIYVECVADAIILQPYGIRLSASDFLLPMVAGNPLDAALIAIREHYRSTNQMGEHGEPYPLLVVRPGGATNYGIARHAMMSWVDEFGYELVTAELPLHFGEQDPVLVNKLQQTIAQAKIEQQHRALAQIENRQLQAIHRSHGGSGGAASGGLRQDRVNGGFTPTHGSWSASTHRSGNSMPSSETAVARPAGAEATRESKLDHHSDPAEAAGSGRMASQQSLGDESGSSGQLSTGVNHGCLADSRGENWALPGGVPRGTGYLRPIRVLCYSDELVLESIGNPRQMRQSVPVNNSADPSMSDLVNAVWEQIDTWGLAASDGYWKPQLRFRVMPNGESRYQQVAEWMRNSGFDIQRDGD